MCMNKFDIEAHMHCMQQELFKTLRLMWKNRESCRKFEDSPMIFLFNNGPHNVVNVKNCESCRKFKESPMPFSFNNEPHNVVNVKNCKCVTYVKIDF